MKSHLKSWAVFLIFLFGSAAIKAGPQGLVDGHLTIISPKWADHSDNMPRPEAPGDYAKYPLVILTQDGKKEVRRITADENGDYRVPLPPGAYILDVQDRVAKRIHARPQPFTVVSNQTVRVDLGIFIGFR